MIKTSEVVAVFCYNKLDWSMFILQNDPNKQTNMPTDGTVHELTSNVSTWHFQQTPISAVEHLMAATPLGCYASLSFMFIILSSGQLLFAAKIFDK